MNVCKVPFYYTKALALAMPLHALHETAGLLNTTHSPTEWLTSFALQVVKQHLPYLSLASHVIAQADSSLQGMRFTGPALPCAIHLL